MAGTLTISTLKNDTGVLSVQNGMTGIAKAWVNYNGSSQVVNASFNVTSVTRNATANYTLNFTTAMPNSNYAWSGASGLNSANQNQLVSGPSATPISTWKTTTSLNVVITYANLSANVDSDNLSVIVIGS